VVPHLWEKKSKGKGLKKEGLTETFIVPHQASPAPSRENFIKGKTKGKKKNRKQRGEKERRR